MGTVFKNANVLTETGFRRCDILVKNGIILDMGNLQQEGVDLKGKTVVPGLWDIHTHGQTATTSTKQPPNKWKKYSTSTHETE